MNIESTTKEFYSFLKSEKNSSSLTILAYKSDMDLFIHFLILNSSLIDVEKITTPIIRRYLNYLNEEKKYKATTINRKINSLRSYFKFLISQDYIDKNPAAPINAPKKPDRVPIYLKEDELKHLINAPNLHSQEHKLRDRAILETLIYTGLRRSELLALNWENVDFGQRIITVRHGKGDKQRIIPIIDSLQETLWTYLQTRLPLHNKNFLFLSDEGNRLSVTALQQMFKRYIKLIGLENKGFTLHKLRHSFASLLIKNNVDLISIQELMGHSDLNSTKVYTHIDTKHKRTQINKIQL